MSSETPGKFTLQKLKETVLKQQGKKRDEVTVRAAFGTDTSVIDLGNGKALAVSSDPLSLIPNLGFKESAWLSVHLTVNDMATTGFAPQYAQFVLNLPVELSQKDFAEYWQHIHTFCEEIDVAITGGHTGRVPGQQSTLPGSATMFLTAPKEEILTSGGAQPGDVLIMTKEAAMVSTAILAKSFPETVKNELGTDLFKQAERNFFRTSVLKEALIASKTLKNNSELKAMHDVTEGGIIGAVCELAVASNCGFELVSENISVGAAQRRIADFFELDYRRIVGAGSMIAAIKPDCAEKLVKALKNEGIEAAVIGKLTDTPEKYELTENGKRSTISYDEEDPYWAAFFKAFEAGLK